MGSGGRNGMPARHRWIGDVLARSGSTLEARDNGTYLVVLGEDLREYLSRDRITITFRKRAARKDGVELASPGSWFHDQLLGFARERGKVAEGYLARREDVDQAALFRSRRRGFLELGELRERRFGTVFLFTFRISYYSEPAIEDVRHVVYDCERRRVMKRAIAADRIVPEPGVPEGAFGESPKANVRKAFQAAWETVQDGIEQQVHAIQQEGKGSIEEKIRTVENYYRQLLAEEKRLLKSRSSRRGERESRDKIDLLKLEWERRVKEETERLKPQVVAALSAMARVWVPLERWRCTVEERGREAERDLWLDLARGEMWDHARGAGQGKRC